MAKITQVKIRDEYITLGQFLKIVDLVNSGGEVKYFLSNNEVIINGEKDNRRGRKLYKDDHILVLKKEYVICL